MIGAEKYVLGSCYEYSGRGLCYYNGEYKKITKSGYNYLMGKKPETWCRAFFSHGYACEVVKNGISECFNEIIQGMRKKPLLSMLD